MKKYSILTIFLISSLFCLPKAYSSTIWGFYGHRLIHKQAIFTLPQPLRKFFLVNLAEMEERAVNPDRRRYVFEEEGPRHFIDIEQYSYEEIHPNFVSFDSLTNKYSNDYLLEAGVNPWHLMKMKWVLIKAFKERDHKKIVRIAADVGHYLADAHVPLHTTKNYNGQLSGQVGIHGLWESRLVELYSEKFNLFTGPAIYCPNLDSLVRSAIMESNHCVSEVLSLELTATELISDEKKYSFSQRGKRRVRTYSKKFCDYYQGLMNGMVEQRLRSSIKHVGVFWYSCWVEAGMPDLVT